MTEVLLFHHAQGLTRGVRSFAETLRGQGHTVHTPDLYDGQVFGTLAEGLDHLGSVGFEAVVERGVRVADDLPSDLVYAGMSLGVMPAQNLAMTRPGARAAVFIDACAPAAAFGGPWPPELRLQIHAMEADALFVGDGDLEAAREIVASTAAAELFLYPGEQHLFADSSLPSFDQAAAGLLQRRVAAFLASVG